MNRFFIILCIIGAYSCDLFRSRPEIRELARNLNTKHIQDMNVCDSFVANIVVKTVFSMNIDDYLHVTKYIPLEAKDNILIGTINKLLMHNDRIFILDRDISKSIFIFRDDGGYISRISKHGSKPDEYRYLRDMEVDTIKRQIIVYDQNGKLLYYDFDGKYIKTKRLGFRFSEFKIFPDEKFLFFTDNNNNHFNTDINDYSLLIGTSESIINFRALKNNNFLTKLNYVGRNNCFGSNGRIYVCPRLSNSIYEVTSGGTLRKLYQIHLPTGTMDDYIQMNPKNFLDEATSKNYFFSLGSDVFINDSIIYFHFFDAKKKYNMLWINRTKNLYYCVNHAFSSTGRIIDLPLPLFSSNNLCIGQIDATLVEQKKKSFIEAHKNYQGEDKIPGSILQKIENMKEDGNPLLVIYKIKW